MGRPPGERAVILFDGVCALCNTGADWIRARDRRGRFEFLPYQSEEARRRFPGLDPARLAEAMHVVFPDGTVRAGVDAAPWIFGELSGWSWLARLLELPGVRQAARPAYAWLARRRLRIRATSGCERTTSSPPPSAP